MKRVLVYARPWNSLQFLDLGKRAWPEHEVLRLSEHKGYDDTGFIEKMYSNFSVGKEGSDIRHLIPFNDQDLSDIVLRCRLLRSIDYDLALRLIFAVTQAIVSVLEKYRPSYILSVTVDSYVIDLLARLAEVKGIRFIGLVPTFVDGYFRITERGKKDFNREVSSAETDAVVSMLSDRMYKPKWLAANKKVIRKKAIRLWARNLVKPAWFAFYSRFKQDPLNAHYMTTDIVSRKYLSLLPSLYCGIDDIGSVKSRVATEQRATLFLPLQMAPEATIDYWSSDRSWIDYEQKVLSVVDNYSDQYIFLVKEHPNVFGFRTSGFYNKLRGAKNVILISPELSSNELIELCDAVLVCTGTVGFEALLRCKPVISAAEPFYAPNNMFHDLDSDIMQHSKCDPHSLVEYLLSGFLPGTFINDGTWSASESSHRVYNSNIAQSLARWL